MISPETPGGGGANAKPRVTVERCKFLPRTQDDNDRRPRFVPAGLVAIEKMLVDRYYCRRRLVVCIDNNRKKTGFL